MVLFEISEWLNTEGFLSKFQVLTFMNYNEPTVTAFSVLLHPNITSSESTVLEEKPSEIHLDDISKNVGDKWRSLLTHLGVPLARSKAFLVECFGNPVSACLEGLVFWREGNKPCKEATWRVLLEALEEGAERKSYAKRLENVLIRNVSEPQPTADRETRRNARECKSKKRDSLKNIRILRFDAFTMMTITRRHNIHLICTLNYNCILKSPHKRQPAFIIVCFIVTNTLLAVL